MATAKPITTKHLLLTTACLASVAVLWGAPGEWWRLAPAPLLVLEFILTPLTREDLTRPIQGKEKRDFLRSLGWLAAFVLTFAVAVHELIPLEWRNVGLDILRHPLLVLSVWGLLQYRLIRRWRQNKTLEQPTQS